MPRLSKIGAAALAAFGWTGLSSVNANYLIVSGGGGGAESNGNAYYKMGGGGAGGLITNTVSLSTAQSYTVVVGAGAPANNNTYSSGIGGFDGSSSSFSPVATTVYGGGGGLSTGTNGPTSGLGSGGGASASSFGNNNTYTGSSGTSGQGYAGGNGTNTSNTSPAYQSGAGGGGAGGAGANGGTGNSPTGGAGGVGYTVSAALGGGTYAGGGGGGGYSTGGSGGSSIGGNGGNGTVGSPGTINTGSGGGGGALAAGTTGGSGGSGVVIISYLGAQQFGGGVVTSSGGYTIHTFNTSGTLAPISSLSASYLIVGGGAAGGAGYGGSGGGGGGAGGYLTGSGLTIDTNSTYLVTVGSGGAGAVYSGSQGANGSNSSLSIYGTAAVGGGGGGTNTNTAGVTGGSGGGSYNGGTAGAATSGQGYAGGVGNTTGSYPNGGGGGGAGAAGQAGQVNTAGGAGGVGLSSSISGTATYYAGGGGGGGQYSGGSGVGGAGGNGGGGAGAVGSASATSGTANLGGGGGGTANNSTNTTGSGGSGVVIISYAGSVQQMAGGTVTISGGNVIHTFTSSGYLTPLKLVNNSLRFRRSNSAYLTRTNPTTGTGGTRIWTLSLWVKRGSLGSVQEFLSPYYGGDGTNESQMYWNSTDVIQVYDSGAVSGYFNYVTTAVYRDPAAWYHVVVSCNTTLATASDRLKLYVNGVQVTSFSTSQAPSQNGLTGYGGTSLTAIGAYARNLSANNFDGYLSEYNFIDGQALTPNSFGTFNSYGVWQPITYGGSYGTNGFYLPFTANASSYAGLFNGSSQYLATTNTQIIPATGDFTVEVMVYKTNTNAVLYSQGTTGNAGRLEVTVVGTGLGVQIGAGSFSSTAVINNNQWYYIALTRTSSTATFYVNGVAAGTGTLSAAVQTTPFWIGLDWTSTYFGGYMSNLRVSNVVRTISPTTAPTTAFTNDASTVFLTLQSSTIVDNSTNAYAITNNGTVTTGKTYPFAYGVFADKSPQGNNWTPTNISGASGSTLDYMTDVPTLTSATVANYAVQNPLYPGSSTLTNGNLQSTAPTTTVLSSASSVSVNSGKWYWEVTVTTINGTNNYPFIGAYRGVPSSLTGAVRPGADTGVNGFSYRQSGIAYVDTATWSSSWGTMANGDVIGIALDLTGLQVSFYKNNTLQGTITGLVAGTYTPAESEYNGSSVAYNFGQQPFAYTPPTGFVALNTYNL